MAYYIGGRVQLAPEAYPGALCEVDSIDSETVLYTVVALAVAYDKAEGAADLTALRDLYGVIESAGRPTWNLVSPKGPIPATAAGMLLVPAPLMLAFVRLWTDTFKEGAPSRTRSASAPKSPASRSRRRTSTT